MIGAGKILISEPYLGDPNFERAVILLCEDNEEGSVGFVLNKPSALTLDTIIDELDEFSQIIHIGGPVGQDSLNFIYRGNIGLEGAVQISDNIYWGGNFEQFIDLAMTSKINSSDFKFFLGYSGWESTQLENEVKENAWIINSPDLNEVFDMSTSNMWQKILHKMGGRYKMYSNYPIDPRLN